MPLLPRLPKVLVWQATPTPPHAKTRHVVRHANVKLKAELATNGGLQMYHSWRGPISDLKASVLSESLETSHVRPFSSAAHYPAKFCWAPCKGMKRQARVGASGMLSTLILERGWDEVSEVAHVSEPWEKYWDDISGKELKPDLVRAAREEELKVVDEMGVWELRPVAECIEVMGKKPVKVRWVDVNKRRRHAQSSMPYCRQGLQYR